MQLLRGMNRPDVPAKSQVINLIGLAILVVPFTIWWGLEGTVIALLVGNLVSQPYLWVHTLRLVHARPSEIARALGPSIAGALAIMAGVLLVGMAGSEFFILVIQVVTGIVTYIGALALWAALFKWNPKHLLKLRA
jgi:O-antigen/teichoic acid export membrane protein